MTTPKTPLFKDLSDAALVEAYWAQRALAANADGIASLNAQCGSYRRANRAVGSIFRALRNIDIIVALAQKRGLNLQQVTA